MEWENFQEIKEILNKLKQNKLIRFGYTQFAYDNDIVEGNYVEVPELNPVNYPNSIPAIDLVPMDELVQDYGYRTNAVSVPRLAFAHFFGRVSYNLNKLIDVLTDVVSNFLVNRYFTPSGKVVESLDVIQKVDRVTITQNQVDVWTASAPITTVTDFDILPPTLTTSAAIGTVGVMTPDMYTSLLSMREQVDYIMGTVVPSIKTSFLELTDTPDSYEGADQKFVIVDGERLAFKNMNDLTVVAPVFTPEGGTVAAGDTVIISTTTPNAEIRYTIDGTNPNKNSFLYTTPIIISSNVTIKAIAYKTNMFTSDTVSASYTVEIQVSTPVFEPSAGTYHISVIVTITTATTGAVIWYTLDGTDPEPTVHGTLYTEPVEITESAALKAIGAMSGATNSNIRNEYYTVTPPVPALSDWTSRQSAVDNSWTSVCYGNGLFVAVASTGTGNRVMTSPDGIIWTSRQSAVDNNWNSVCYGNGLFVAVATSGTGNRVMTSPNGINWTSRTSAANNNWWSVCYGNGLFVAVSTTGTGNRVMTSPDGITWTSRQSAADNWWNSVCYGNGLFVAVSWSGTGNRVMTSPDGITWTSRQSAVDNEWRSVCYGNGLFVAVASTGTGNGVMTSPDGITWTSRQSAANNYWWSVCYGNGLFVAVSTTSGTGNRVMTSPDGVTWTIGSPAANNYWYSVCYENGLFVAVSTTGTGNRVMTAELIWV